MTECLFGLVDLKAANGNSNKSRAGPLSLDPRPVSPARGGEGRNAPFACREVYALCDGHGSSWESGA